MNWLRRLPSHHAPLVAAIALLAIIGAACTSDSTPDEEPTRPAPAVEPEEQVSDQDRPALDSQEQDVPVETPPAPLPQPEPDDTPPVEPSRVDEIMQEPATLVRVIDGDTIEVRFDDGTTETVRYIGIDTPETVAPGRPVEPFGPEASALNKELLAAGEVFLERDTSERDRFGRLLRYVYAVDATGALFFVNAALVRAGLATVATFPPDVKYVDIFVGAQDAAQADGLGIWASAPGSEPAVQRCDPAYPSVCIPPPPPDLDCGEISFRRFTVLAPDPHGFDRDRDGIGCES